MHKDELVKAFTGPLPAQLAKDIVDEFLALRQDVATGTLGRSAPGKFVETLVQGLQFLESGKFEQKPSVDDYLRNLESRSVPLDDGIRICAARIGRAMYTLRNKRNISHKGQVDPNTYDLRYLLSGTQWILAELIRLTSGLSMEEAGKLIEQVQTPVGGLVEDFGTRKLVLTDLPTREEILVLLHSHYPDPVTNPQITSSLDRRSDKTVRNVLRTLWKTKLIEGNNKNGYKLTRRGFSEATTVVSRCVASQTEV